jgi:hypothetical protein
MVDTVSASFSKFGLPKPEFSTADRATFNQVAQANFDQFNFIGESALDELRFNLHNQAITGQPLSSFVDTIKSATVGVGAAGSPLANHATTYANTAILSFGGETIKQAGEAIGAELWEVVGPSDQKTREECQQALADPIRTKDEWMQHSGADGQPYWGGTPGGWNCRHQLFPVL